LEPARQAIATPLEWVEKRWLQESRPSALLPKLPGSYPRLVDPYDPREDLDARARSYLHANCSQCHVEAGGGNAAIELEFDRPRRRMRLFDVRPLHDTFGIADAKLVAPGDPERSVLYQRVARRGPGQMPPLATAEVDRQAVQLLYDWIKQMKPEAKKSPTAGQP
jgi:mono/diheme cytochrome c family protein